MHPIQVLQLLIVISITILVEARNYTRISTKTRCNKSCGEVSIPYPFGIGRKCSVNKWYRVDCNSSTPYLYALNNVEVLNVSLSPRLVTVNVPMTSDCKNPLQNNNLILNKSPFVFSGYDNLLVVEGCGNASLMEENGDIVTGCSTTCGEDTVSDINNFFGIGCCESAIPYDLGSFTLNLTGLEGHAGNGSCGYGFLVDKNSFMEARFSRQFVPVTLLWTQTLTEESICSERNGGVCYHAP